ncbi:MAG: site-2 protease family protein [Desulfonatronovibrio sp.]
MFDITQIITTLVLIAFPLFMAIIFHEVAHGYTAYRLGDPTAKNAGRLTLNPLRHVDPLGTIIFPLMLVLIKSPFLFGWAKPVPFNPAYFENPRKGIFWVALAGPATNFALAAGFFLLFKFLTMFQPSSATAVGETVLTPVMLICFYGILVNIILGLFNLFPIPPLDGSKVLATFLPGRLASQYMKLEKYGFLIIILLIFTGVIGWIFSHVFNSVYQLVM